VSKVVNKSKRKMSCAVSWKVFTQTQFKNLVHFIAHWTIGVSIYSCFPMPEAGP